MLEVPVPYRVRAAGVSKVAGSLRRDFAGWVEILQTFVRVAREQ